MSTSRRKNIYLFVLLIFLAGAAIAYYFYNKGPLNIQNASAVNIEAAALYTAFLNDSAAAQKKYSGKVLIVNGIVAQINSNQQGQPVILLQTSNGSGFINCTLDKKNGNPVKEKQSILIKGICSGLGQADTDLGLQPDLYLERCIIQP